MMACSNLWNIVDKVLILFVKRRINMFLAPYIKELLFTYECVVIPGMGAFITQFKPPQLQADKSLMPPAKIAGYNPDITEDDGLLVAHLCRRLNQTDAAVRKLIAREIAYLYETLAGGNPFVMDGIGVFSLDRSGSLTFSANQEANFLLDSFGLAAFKFPLLEARSTPFHKNPIFFRQKNEPVRESLPGTQLATNRSRISPLMLVAAFAILIFVSLIPYNTRVTDALFRQPAALGPLPSLREVDPDPSMNYNQDTMVQNPPQQLNPAASASGNSPKSFPVIAGSFESRQNASDLVSSLMKKGYPARIDVSAQGLFRVVIQDFTQLKQAEAGLIQLQNENPVLQLWILK